MSATQKFGKNEARMIAEAIREVPRAVIDYRSQNQPDLFRDIEIDLNIERTDSNPLVLGFVFQSAYVELATDGDVFCEIKPNAQKDGMKGATMRLNGVLNFDQPVRGLCITNPIQAGSMKIRFFLYSNYIPGSTVIDLNSNVNNITVGGSTVNNFGEGVHLRANTFSLFPDWHDPDTFAANTAYSLNKANTGSVSRYIVPAGKELVITGADVYNISTMGINVYLVIGAVPSSLILGGGESIVNANLAAWLAWASGGEAGADSILFGGANSIFQENKSKAGSPNPFGAFVIPEGHGVAIGLYVDTDDPDSNTGAGFEVDVIGLLRDKV